MMHLHVQAKANVQKQTKHCTTSTISRHCHCTCVTTKPRDIRQLASECSQIMAGVYYVVTLAT